MKHGFAIVFLLVAFFNNVINSNACTIFMANDGHRVWIGNNEDEAPSLTYRLWYYPAAGGNYGYMLWTELSDDGKLDHLMYKNPQGGMNEWGLFLDYTAIEDIPAVKEEGKENREEEVVTDILKQCKTVDEALKYISRFNLVRLTGAQLFLADANGKYAVAHGSYIITPETRNFALTNYSIKNAHHEACWRRDAATEYLSGDRHYRLPDIVALLQRTTQKKPSNLVSNYSMAADLHAKTIHLYYKNDFSTPAVISLAAELKSGEHYRDMVSYFPLRLTGIIAEKYNSGGIDSAIATYEYLRKNCSGKYNFKNNDAIDLALLAIAEGKTRDGIRFLECLKRYDPERRDIDTWLGVAYRRDDNIKESRRCFDKVLAVDPDNYVAILFGRQKDHNVTFRMKDFEAAEEVSLAGDFSKWKPIPMKKEKGMWTCQVQIPPGAYNYKFIINKEYLADQINLMYTGSGPDIYSKLYVW
jgi:tetratricopeptide (TPR) repeat protein